jgi:hypothetical protein
MGVPTAHRHQHHQQHAPSVSTTTSSSSSSSSSSAAAHGDAAAAHASVQPQQQQQQQQQARSNQAARPLQQLSAQRLCAGSRIVLPCPPPRQRSEALVARLAQLQEQLDARKYAAMVADVMPQGEAEAAAAAAAAAAGRSAEDAFFPTTKLQLSFGLHVLATMGAFFAAGFYGGRFVFRDESWVSSARVCRGGGGAREGVCATSARVFGGRGDGCSRARGVHSCRQ